MNSDNLDNLEIDLKNEDNNKPSVIKIPYSKAKDLLPRKPITEGQLKAFQKMREALEKKQEEKRLLKQMEQQNGTINVEVLPKSNRGRKKGGKNQQPQQQPQPQPQQPQRSIPIAENQLDEMINKLSLQLKTFQEMNNNKMREPPSVPMGVNYNPMSYYPYPPYPPYPQPSQPERKTKTKTSKAKTSKTSKAKTKKPTSYYSDDETTEVETTETENETDVETRISRLDKINNLLNSKKSLNPSFSVF